jgi:hypothetical protein
MYINMVLRRIFGPRRDEVTGEWRKLQNEELHDSYSSPSIISIIKSRKLRWTGHVARVGEKTSACRLLVRKPERKIPLGRQRRRWVDNIKIEVEWGNVDWIGLAEDRDRWRALACKSMPHNHQLCPHTYEKGVGDIAT